jgi:hypothetical protein
MKSYPMKRGPADPFRGDWYAQEDEFNELQIAIESAAAFTLKSYHELNTSCEEFGYEWSVFEKDGDTEIKIWEGYKYIQEIKALDESGNLDLGFIK